MSKYFAIAIILVFNILSSKTSTALTCCEITDECKKPTTCDNNTTTCYVERKPNETDKAGCGNNKCKEQNEKNNTDSESCFSCSTDDCTKEKILSLKSKNTKSVEIKNETRTCCTNEDCTNPKECEDAVTQCYLKHESNGDNSGCRPIKNAPGYFKDEECNDMNEEVKTLNDKAKKFCYLCDENSCNKKSKIDWNKFGMPPTSTTTTAIDKPQFKCKKCLSLAPDACNIEEEICGSGNTCYVQIIKEQKLFVQGCRNAYAPCAITAGFYCQQCDKPLCNQMDVAQMNAEFKKLTIPAVVTTATTKTSATKATTNPTTQKPENTTKKKEEDYDYNNMTGDKLHPYKLYCFKCNGISCNSHKKWEREICDVGNHECISIKYSNSDKDSLSGDVIYTKGCNLAVVGPELCKRALAKNGYCNICKANMCNSGNRIEHSYLFLIWRFLIIYFVY